MPGKLNIIAVQGSEQDKTFVFETHDTLLPGRKGQLELAETQGTRPAS